ncbi:hypothetical protein LSPH24S_04372 [Lysinibacillus sphaericus]
MIDIATSLHTLYPNITIDGKIGRQVSQAVKRSLVTPALINLIKLSLFNLAQTDTLQMTKLTRFLVLFLKQKYI